MKSPNGDIGTDVNDDYSTPFTLVNRTETVSFNGNLFTAVSTTTSGVTQWAIGQTLTKLFPVEAHTGLPMWWLYPHGGCNG
jgi:hypothetical protein